VKRERYLSATEIDSLSKALNNHPDKQAANVIRLLLLTGARKAEVLNARWEQFDLAGGVWTKPGATTKQKTTHRVPLSAPRRPRQRKRKSYRLGYFPAALTAHRARTFGAHGGRYAKPPDSRRTPEFMI
jgi:integrase